jgi:Domain of unknown function (DUF4145)
MFILPDNTPTYMFDRDFSLTCPHCGVRSNISAVSFPRFEYIRRFQLSKVGIVYRCDACNEPIFLRFMITFNQVNGRYYIQEGYEEVERPQETFEFKYLSGDVRDDFAEALGCYSNQLLNAFAAICRRTIQSACTQLGAGGTDKVMNQLKDLKELTQIDDDTFAALKQIIIDGHDGAHPHLPKLGTARAAVLLELMKDVLYQLFVRPTKLKEATALRAAAIEASKGKTT